MSDGSEHGSGGSGAFSSPAVSSQALQLSAAPHVMLMRLIMDCNTPADVVAALQAERACAYGPDRERIEAVARLWRETPDAWRLVKSILDCVPHETTGVQADAVSRWSDAFDRAASISGEAGVALYALGRKDLLHRATTEVVAALARWTGSGSHGVVLEVGCGIGRFAEAMAATTGHFVGVDVSFAMLTQARKRCAVLGNVSFLHTSGRDLRMIADRASDLVLAVDAFPYLVLSGDALVSAHVREFARVLRPAGHAAILNFSYGGDLAADRARVGDLARNHGLDVLLDGARELEWWDGACFLLQKA